MNRLKQMIIGKQGASDKANFMWNTIGSGTNAVACILLSFLTIRIMGENEGGIFSIALTISQMLMCIAYFEMRTYQVTDAKNEFSFKEYYSSKWVTCGLMLLISVVYTFAKGYDRYKATIVLLMCIYRAIDGFADVFEAQFHKNGRMDIAGKSLAYRTGLTVITYFIVLLITRNLLYASCAMVIVAVIGVICFDVIIYQEFGKIAFQFNANRILDIIRACFPQFMVFFLSRYILSASRLAVDVVMDYGAQAYYQVLFLPISVINFFGSILVRPMLTKLTDMYSGAEYKNFLKIITRLVLAIVAGTVVCMAGSYVIGIPVLEFLVHLDLKEYKGLFVCLVAAGGVNAVARVGYYVLSIFRSQKLIMIGYLFSAVLAHYISLIFVKESGLWGVGMSYFAVVLVLNVFFVVTIWKKMRHTVLDNKREGKM